MKNVFISSFNLTFFFLSQNDYYYYLVVCCATIYAIATKQHSTVIIFIRHAGHKERKAKKRRVGKIHFATNRAVSTTNQHQHLLRKIERKMKLLIAFGLLVWAIRLYVRFPSQFCANSTIRA